MSFSLEHHLKEKHAVTPFSQYLREIVYGGTDGIVTTFAVVAGFAGAQSQDVAVIPVLTVLVFGFANLFADGVSMSLGGFLATSSDHDKYRSEQKKELYEITHHPEDERMETIEILEQKGFTKKQAQEITTLYESNPSYWLNFMMSEELTMANPEGEKPVLMSVATFISFVTFGFLPLIPYVIMKGSPVVFSISIVTTGIALFLLGILRYAVTRQSLLRAVFESVLLGGMAATVAYVVGRAIKI